MALDPARALEDFKQALRLNPRSLAALRNQAHVLAERLGQTRPAIEVLDRLLEMYPDQVAARAGRGVLLARLGERDRALQDAEVCLAGDARPETLYQIAGIYAQTSQLQPEDRWDALRYLGLALRKGHGLDLIDRDPDLDPLRELPEFQRLVTRVRPIRASAETVPVGR
jgi:tetratricopeptide (TPR) repeat protein